jgi:putative inorganic carbon (hco3(-)) transporter
MTALTIRERAPAYFAGASAAVVTVSIAASQTLLGFAIASLLLDHRKLRWPPVTAPLLTFMVWTLLSLAASPDPHRGLPQIKKFYVYLILFAVFSALRTVREVRWVAYGWAIGGSVSALWAMRQGYQMYRASDEYFYFVYSNGSRVTGFMAHWMTFSGISMMALLITGALLLFDRNRRFVNYLGAAAFLLGMGILAAWQRSFWAGTTVAAMWLLWERKRRLVLMAPAVIAVVLAVNPLSVRDHLLVLFRPQYNLLDSRAHRAALRATGWEMIKAHRLVGVGPEQIRKRFYDYAPPEVPNPVPESWSIEHLHNLYYQYAAERGIPALLALLWFLGRVLCDFWRARNTVSEGRWMLNGAIACIIGIMVSGWGEVNLGDSEPLGMFLSIIACGYVVARQPQPI